jgi:hypothetical protein
MTRSVREVIMTLVEDPWQARLDRMRQLLPLPLLALSTAIAFAAPASAFHRWARFELGLPLTAASWPDAYPHPARPELSFELDGRVRGTAVGGRGGVRIMGAWAAAGLEHAESSASWPRPGG